MKRLTSIFVFVSAFLSIVLYSGGVEPVSYNCSEQIVTGSYLEEGHNLVGDLEFKEQSRTHSVKPNNLKNFLSPFQSDFIVDNINYSLLVKSAKGFLLLKKHLLLIYVFHYFW